MGMLDWILSLSPCVCSRNARFNMWNQEDRHQKQGTGHTTEKRMIREDHHQDILLFPEA